MKPFNQSQFDSSILKFIVIVMVPIVAGLCMFVRELWSDRVALSLIDNGYVAPRNVYGVV
jgi:hypothetical protein